MMEKNLRQEILSFLATHGKESVDICPLLNIMVAHGRHSSGYLVIMMQSMCANHLLWYDELQLAKYYPHGPVMARIEPEGLKEFKRVTNMKVKS